MPTVTRVYGSNVCYEGEEQVSYGTSPAKVFEIEPLAFLSGLPIRDWEGFLLFMEKSGNDVTVEIRVAAGSVEAEEATLTVYASKSGQYAMSKTLRHAVYLSSTGTGDMVIAWRICYYYEARR